MLAAIDSDLHNAQVPGLSADWRMSIAYNAAMRAATTALAACGYRAGRDAHHYRVIQSLELTIDLDERTVSQLEAFRKKRNISNYDRTGAVSTQEADEMLALAHTIRESVVDWLHAHKADLLG